MKDKPLYHIGLNMEGEIVVGLPDDEIIFPQHISRLLYYSMCAFYNNQNNNNQRTSKVC